MPQGPKRRLGGEVVVAPQLFVGRTGDLNAPRLAVAFHAAGRVYSLAPDVIKQLLVTNHARHRRSGMQPDPHLDRVGQCGRHRKHIQRHLRHTVRRVQTLMTHPYAEIRDNVISADMLPIDILRCKLSFFGATKFDPRSDRWVRICMYQDAPFPHELLEAAP